MDWPWLVLVTLVHIYRLQTKLRKGNVSTLVSDSVHSTGEGEVYTPWADTPPGQTPPPWADTPPPGWPLQRMVRILLKCILVISVMSRAYMTKGRMTTDINTTCPKLFGRKRRRLLN